MPPTKHDDPARLIYLRPGETDAEYRERMGFSKPSNSSKRKDHHSVIGSVSASSVLGGISKLATYPMKQKIIDARNILKDNMIRTIERLNQSKRLEPTSANSSSLQNWGPKNEQMKRETRQEYEAACAILNNPDKMTTMKAAMPSVFFSPQALANHVMNMVKGSHPHLIQLQRDAAAAAKADAAAAAAAAADSSDSDQDGGKKKTSKSRKSRKSRKSGKSRKNRKTRSRK
jgi:hypothetical protein